jgi:hypothetical protein
MALSIGRITTTLMAIALALSAAGGCGSTGDDAEPAPKPGAVTLRFTNPSSVNAYIDVTFGTPYELFFAGTEVRKRSGCTALCQASCECYYCSAGMPLPSVRRIPPGGFVEVVWEGDYYERVQAGCGNGQCDCELERFSKFGSYEASLQAGLAVTGGTASPEDPDLLRDANVDSTAGSCTAAGSFQLDAEPRTVEIPLACP